MVDDLRSSVPMTHFYDVGWTSVFPTTTLFLDALVQVGSHATVPLVSLGPPQGRRDEI